MDVRKARKMVRNSEDDIARKARAAADRAERAAIKARREKMKAQRQQQVPQLLELLKSKVKDKDSRVSQEVKEVRSTNPVIYDTTLDIEGQLQQQVGQGVAPRWIDYSQRKPIMTIGQGKGPKGQIFTGKEVQIDPNLLETQGLWQKVDDKWLWVPVELL